MHGQPAGVETATVSAATPAQGVVIPLGGFPVLSTTQEAFALDLRRADHGDRRRPFQGRARNSRTGHHDLIERGRRLAAGRGLARGLLRGQLRVRGAGEENARQGQGDECGQRMPAQSVGGLHVMSFDRGNRNAGL